MATRNEGEAKCTFIEGMQADTCLSTRLSFFFFNFEVETEFIPLDF